MELLKRLKFWIGLGLLVLVSGVVLGVWFFPARKENSDLAAKWEQKVSSAESLAGQDVPARGQAALFQKTADQVAERRKALQQSQAKSKVDLSAPIPDPETGEQRPDLEPGIWKIVYEDAMRALDRDIRRSFVQVTPTQMVTMKQFPGIWPSQQEVAAETRSYWIQRYILEALASINADRVTAPYLRGFELMPQPERFLAATDAEVYRPQGFQCTFEAEVGMLPYILERLASCEIPVSITSVDVSRPDAALEAAARSQVPQQKGLVEAEVVGGGAGPRGGPPPGYLGPPAGVVGPPGGFGGPRGPMSGRPGGFGGPRGPMSGRAGGSGGPRGPVSGPTGRRPGAGRTPALPGGAPQEEAGLHVKARYIPAALVEVTIKAYANVPRPAQEPQTESEKS